MTYTFNYDGTNFPKWEKIFTAANGETFSVSLVFENKEDRLQLTSEQVFGFLDLMLQYVKDRTQELSVVQLNQDAPDSQWPFNENYDDVENFVFEIQKWWNWAYFNDDFDTEGA